MPPANWKIKPPLDGSGAVWLGPSGRAGQDGLWFGTLAEISTGAVRQVWLSTAKEQVVALVGKRGSGKSFSLGVIAEGLALSSDSPSVATQSRRRATILFDPLDVYWTTRFAVGPSSNAEAQRHFELARSYGLHEASVDVQAWVPGSSNARSSDPEWFQTLQLPVPGLGLEEWELLLGANLMAEPMGQAFADVLELVRSSGFHVQGTPAAPIAVFGIEDLIRTVHADELSGTYHAETLRALRQRLSSLQSTGLFSANGTPITQMLAPGRLAVVLLGRLAQSYRAAVVALLTRMLVEQRMNVAFAERRLALDPGLSQEERHTLEALIAGGIPRTVVALDEAQTFLAPNTANSTREVFVRLVKEGRNVGLSVVIATQQPSALDGRILSQVETFIAHQLVTDPDIQAVRSNLKSAVPDGIEFGNQTLDFSHLLRRLPPGQCLVSSADMSTSVRRTIVVTVRPRASVHGGIEL